MKTYYTLAEYDERKQTWSPQYGSYVKSEVFAELRDYQSQGIQSSKLAIVASKDDQPSILKAISAL